MSSYLNIYMYKNPSVTRCLRFYFKHTDSAFIGSVVWVETVGEAVCWFLLGHSVRLQCCCECRPEIEARAAATPHHPARLDLSPLHRPALFWD